MTKADQAVESAADQVETFVNENRNGGGVKAKVASVLADDPAFIRKLKPSLVKARATGHAPTDEQAGGEKQAPSGPQLARPEQKPKSKGGGPSPWLIVGAALAVGWVVAKSIDWRGHAHPRS